MRSQRGFSLVEVAMVMVVLGLVLGGLLMAIGAYQKVQRHQQSQRQLAEARDALLGFAAARGRLPCPAAPGGDGAERAATGTGCTGGQHGELPWSTLGLPPLDAWAQPMGYAVSAQFSRSSTGAFAGCPPGQPATPPANAVFALCSLGTLAIRDLAGQPQASEVPAVVWSPGPEGHIAGTPEDENRDNDDDFVGDTPTDAYDDLLVWVPPTVLVNRMVQAGRLP